MNDGLGLVNTGRDGGRLSVRCYSRTVDAQKIARNRERR